MFDFSKYKSCKTCMSMMLPYSCINGHLIYPCSTSAVLSATYLLKKEPFSCLSAASDSSAFSAFSVSSVFGVSAGSVFPGVALETDLETYSQQFYSNSFITLRPTFSLSRGQCYQTFLRFFIIGQTL